MKQIKILLVGVGGYGENYVRELLADSDGSTVIEGICDPFASACREYERILEHKIPVYNTLQEFYGSHRADLAVISSPIHLHCSQTIECLANRSNVLCEKPLCADYGQAVQMLEAQKKSALFVAIGYQLCYSKDVLALKKDIMADRFGKPLDLKAIHAMRRGSTYYARNGWAGRIARNGNRIYDSPVSNACAHQFHNMLFLLGSTINRTAGVKAIDAQLYKANPNIENFDTAAFRCVTDENVPIEYYTSHAIKQNRVGPLSEYRFEKATVYFGLDGVNEYVARFHDGKCVSYGDIPKGKRLQKLYDAIDCVRTQSEPLCTIETAMPHVQCVERMQECGVVPVDEDNIIQWKEDGDVFYSIKGLEEKLIDCYKRNKLPKEAGIPIEY